MSFLNQDAMLVTAVHGPAASSVLYCTDATPLVASLEVPLTAN